MLPFLVAYKTPELEVRGKWVDAAHYDAARAIVRKMNDPRILFVCDGPIGVQGKNIDNPTPHDLEETDINSSSRTLIAWGKEPNYD